MTFKKPAAIFTFGVIAGLGGALLAPVINHILSATNQPYANEQGRQISSLSAKDIASLKAGEGWGLAKPAEFNGYPGPAHVLELADKLSLTAAQSKAVHMSFAKMQANARSLGEGLIEAEAALDAAFKSKAIDAEKLAALIFEAEGLRASLRATHLSAHLEITPLLSDEQKTLYASLRGYQNGHRGHEGH